jgi:hypothetical protein
MKVTPEYIEEKIEAYNLAIECLRHHEPASVEVNPKQAKALRMRLADKLDREIQKWCDKNIRSAD